MARHPTMRTTDGRWQVEIITGRTGQQSFRARRLDAVAGAGTWWPTGHLVATIEEVRELLGESFELLAEDHRHHR